MQTTVRSFLFTTIDYFALKAEKLQYGNAKNEFCSHYILEQNLQFQTMFHTQKTFLFLRKKVIHTISAKFRIVIQKS